MCVGGENTLVWSIWTNITGYIVKMLTSVRKHMQNSAQHRILFISMGSYGAINVENGFSSRSHVSSPCMCVTGLTGQPTYGNCVQESKLKKKTGILHDVSRSSIKPEILVQISQTQVLNTSPFPPAYARTLQ